MRLVSLAGRRRPLHAAFLGPLTDAASALLPDRSTADRDMPVIWIGGAPYDDEVATYSPELALGNDVAAADVVFARSSHTRGRLKHRSLAD